MSDPLRQDFAFEPGPAVVETPPQVLTRLITTPPAPPWEQARAANLEARHAAPLPPSELIHRVKRLSGWAPGRPGRFGIFYVRAKEFRAPFEAQVEVEGQTVRVAFGLGGEQVRRVRGLGVLLAFFVLVGAVLGTGVTLALAARAQATARLEAAETQSRRTYAAARAYRGQVAQARQLRAALGRGRPIDDMVEDLTWVAASKAPEARIAAVHWQGGVMAVEVRGEAPPFPAPDRRLERAPQPLRPGVWLWGVGAKLGPGERAAPAGGARP